MTLILVQRKSVNSQAINLATELAGITADGSHPVYMTMWPLENNNIYEESFCWEDTFMHLSSLSHMHIYWRTFFFIK